MDIDWEKLARQEWDASSFLTCIRNVASALRGLDPRPVGPKSATMTTNAAITLRTRNGALAAECIYAQTLDREQSVRAEVDV